MNLAAILVRQTLPRSNATSCLRSSSTTGPAPVCGLKGIRPSRASSMWNRTDGTSSPTTIKRPVGSAEARAVLRGPRYERSNVIHVGLLPASDGEAGSIGAAQFVTGEAEASGVPLTGACDRGWAAADPQLTVIPTESASRDNTARNSTWFTQPLQQWSPAVPPPPRPNYRLRT